MLQRFGGHHGVVHRSLPGRHGLRKDGRKINIMLAGPTAGDAETRHRVIVDLTNAAHNGTVADTILQVEHQTGIGTIGIGKAEQSGASR